MSLAGLWLAACLTAAAQDGKPDLTAADAAASAGLWSEAEALYRAELERAPESPEAALGLARALESLSSPESAIAYYMLSTLDDQPQAVAARAGLLESLGRPGEAADEYTRLLLLQPPSLDVLLGLARSLEGDSQHREAAAVYRDILAEWPERLDARLALGRALQRSGQRASAIEAYQPLLRIEGSSGPYPAAERRQLAAAAAEALGPLLESAGEAEAAAEVYLLLPQLRPEADARRWWRAAVGVLCETDPLRASELLGRLGTERADAEVIRCLADALYEAGEGDAAGDAYRKILTMPPESRLPEALREHAGRRLERVQITTAAERLSLVADRELSSGEQAAVQAAQAAAQAGRRAEALAGLRAVVAGARHCSEAWAALGDMQSEFGEIADAEESYLTAVAIAPGDGRWRTRLALLLARAYSGTRHEEAIEEISRAIRSGPHPPALRYERGVMYIGNREFDPAAADLEAYLQAAPGGDHAADAERLLTNLRRQPPEIRPPELPAPPIQDVPAEAEEHFRLARAHLERGGEETDALREIRLAIEAAPGWQMALDLYGDLAWDAGEEEAAIAAWEDALEVEPPPPGLQLKLARVYGLRGEAERAEALLTRAAAAGTVEAYYALAELSFDRREHAAARRWLEAFFDSATGGPDYQTALALKAELDSIQERRQVAAAAGGAAVLIVAGGLWWRRQRQRTLQDLLAEAPESSHDLARLLSAVRHEVLKHNTTLLEEMAYAGRNGDHSALRWAAERLFGEDGGAVRRYGEYRAAIERLGRKHGLHLDLKGRDPVFAPMSRAMAQLGRMEGALRDPERAGDLEAPLMALHEALNIDAYQALGRLIQQMGTLTIDEALLRAVDQRVRAEPGLAEAELPPLQIEGARAGLPARVFSGDLEDIVANLLRNAYLASIDGLPPGEREVALLVEEDDDPITGFELVALRFCDQAPGELTSAMIQGRSIGRGLGLAVDLIARHNGSIDVEAEPGWRKAVVVRLPRAEGDDSDTLDVMVREEEEEP